MCTSAETFCPDPRKTARIPIRSRQPFLLLSPLISLPPRFLELIGLHLQEGGFEPPPPSGGFDC